MDYLAVLRQMRPLTDQFNLYKPDFEVCAKETNVFLSNSLLFTLVVS